MSRVAVNDRGAARKIADSGGITLKYQDSLPKLPIPPLDATLDKYLRALEGLQSPQEHERTAAVVKEFRESGEGQRFLERLQKYAETRSSYIEEFW
jgi:carnitine O-acetyltransferase